MKSSEARELALSLPEAREQDHHGFPSFRVANKIFATLPDEGTLNIMLGPEEAEGALGADPSACQELWWGKSLAGVRVELSAANPGVVDDLLRQAWRRRAPKKLHVLLDER